MMNSGLKIETRDLTKKFGNFTAVDTLNLMIESGESYGFLGPNGAGKTTTLLMMLGIQKPTSGTVLINNQDVLNRSFSLKDRIGVVAEYQSFYDEMSAWEYLMFFANLFKVTKPEEKGRELLENLSLWDWRDVLIGGYSTGMKKKLGFARALVHTPDLLILDEPVSGLDPFGIIQVREMLKAEQAKGCTLLISSHILSEVEKTVDQVGIIANGTLILQDTMANLRQRVTGTQNIELTFAAIGDADVGALRQLPFVTQIDQVDTHLVIQTRDDQDYREIIGRTVMERHLVLTEMKKAEKSLEEAFVTITEKNLVHLAGEGRNK